MALVVGTTGMAIAIAMSRLEIKDAIKSASDKYMFEIEDLDRFLGIDSSDVLVWRRSQSTGFLLFAESERAIIREDARFTTDKLESSIKQIMASWNDLSTGERGEWIARAEPDSDYVLSAC
jgi:hypothetical protein